MNKNNRLLKVFLCHASNDKPAVRKLYDKLVKSGIDVWLDEKKLIAGQHWDIEIQKAVRESDIVVICLSKASITKEGYIQKEIKFALDIALEKPEDTIYLIPARIEDCKVPQSLSAYQWIDMFNEDGYIKLEKSLMTRAASLGVSIGNELLLPFDLKENDITLWGIGGSGKTWLTRAFAKELFWYNQHDPDFSYELYSEEVIHFPAPPSNTEITPTIDIEDYSWTFNRKHKTNHRSYQLSNHSHKILLHDSPGTKSENNSKEVLGLDLITSYILKTSRNIIVLLDPTTVENSPVANFENKIFPATNYSKLIRSLVDVVLSDTKNEKVRIAICVSKSDLLKIKLSAEEVVRVIFGDEIIHSLSSERIEKNFFKVSSVGYIRTNRKLIPNINTISGNLLDEENWNPIGVTSPFFWFFEAIERERLSKSGFLGTRNRMYIPYPPPRNL